jgi:hypothetical protein
MVLPIAFSIAPIQLPLDVIIGNIFVPEYYRHFMEKICAFFLNFVL